MKNLYIAARNTNILGGEAVFDAPSMFTVAALLEVFMLVHMELWAGSLTAEGPVHTDGPLTSTVAGIAA